MFLTLFTSCENQLESESNTYRCYGNLASPQMTLTSTNDWPLTSGANGSSYRFLVQYDSPCMFDNNSKLNVRLEYYNEDDILISTSNLQYTYNNYVYNHTTYLESSMGIRFGSRAKKVKLTFSMTSPRGNEVSIEIEKNDNQN